MREIKFRVWDSVLNEYRTLDMNSGKQNLGMGFEVTGGIGSNITEIYRSVGDIIEQFIGLKDKNGVDVYEGDIVKVLDGEDVEDPYYAYLEIRYAQGKFYFHNAYAVKFDDVLDGVVLDVEVIGNIHQNKNLLVNDTNRISPDDIGNDIHEFLHGGDKR